MGSGSARRQRAAATGVACFCPGSSTVREVGAAAARRGTYPRRQSATLLPCELLGDRRPTAVLSPAVAAWCGLRGGRGRVLRAGDRVERLAGVAHEEGKGDGIGQYQCQGERDDREQDTLAGDRQHRVPPYLPRQRRSECDSRTIAAGGARGYRRSHAGAVRLPTQPGARNLCCGGATW